MKLTLNYNDINRCVVHAINKINYLDVLFKDT